MKILPSICLELFFFSLFCNHAQSGWLPLGIYEEDNPLAWEQSVAEGAAYASSGNSIFSFGGFTYDDTTLYSRNDLWKFNGDTSEWTLLEDMSLSDLVPAPRGRACMLVRSNDSELFIFGGRLRTQNTLAEFSDVWSWSMRSEWTKRSSTTSFGAPPARGSSVCALRGDNVLVFGGANAAGDVFSDLWSFDTVTNQWSSILLSSYQTKHSLSLYSVLTAVRSPLKLYSMLTAVKSPYLFGAAAMYNKDDDVWVITGGRMPGVSGMTSNAIVSSSTYAILFIETENGTITNGLFFEVRTVGYSPGRAYPQSFSLLGKSLCMFGGASYIGISGEQRTSSIYCLRFENLLNASAQAKSTWLELSNQYTGSLLPIPRERSFGGIVTLSNLKNLSEHSNLVVSGGLSNDFVLGDTWIITLPNFNVSGAWNLAVGPPIQGSRIYSMVVGSFILILVTLTVVLYAWKRRRDALDTIDIVEEPEIPRGLDSNLLGLLNVYTYSRPPKVRSNEQQSAGSGSGGSSPTSAPWRQTGSSFLQQTSTPFGWAAVSIVDSNILDPSGNIIGTDTSLGITDSNSPSTSTTSAIGSTPSRITEPISKQDITDCSICLCEFDSGDVITELPCHADHKFHSRCVNKWLIASTTCPLCKKDVEELLTGIPSANLNRPQ